MLVTMKRRYFSFCTGFLRAQQPHAQTLRFQHRSFSLTAGNRTLETLFIPDRRTTLDQKNY